MEFLLDGISMLSWKQIVMYGVGICLIWLQLKGYEPSLLLPMGFGAILVKFAAKWCDRPADQRCR